MAEAARHRLDEAEPELATVVQMPGLAEASKVIEETAQHAQQEIDRVKRRTDRNRNVTIAIVVLIAMVALLLGAWNQQRIEPLETTTAINTSAIEALERARDELRAAGVPEEELPPPVVVNPSEPVDVDAIIQATSATILARIRTDPNFRGAAGLQGDPGINGINGVSPPCLADENQCQGPRGEQGIQGVQGTQGVQGDKGEEGEQGPRGQEGATGPMGPAGPAGETCPPGTSLQPVTVMVPDDNSVIPGYREETITACRPV